MFKMPHKGQRVGKHSPGHGRPPSRGEVRLPKNIDDVIVIEMGRRDDDQLYEPFDRMFEDDNVFLAIHVIYILCAIALGIVLIWRGVGIRDNCMIAQVSVFFVISGAYTCLIGTLRLIHVVIIRLRTRNLRGTTHQLCAIIRPILFSIIELALLIWGTVILGRNYSHWVSDDAASEHFCPGDALGLLTFVVLFGWLAPIVLCCGCCGITCVCFCVSIYRSYEKYQKKIATEN